MRSLIALSLVSFLLAPADGRSQVGASRNASLLSRFDPPGASYNDVWGYVSPTGKEYAILGSTSGTYIVDCSDPRNPVQRAFFSGPSSTWRDMRAYKQYVYVVTEGGGGVQIIDMSDPDHPVLVTTWGSSVFTHAHNVALDTATGRLYPCGTNNGTPIIDLEPNPLDPVLVGRYTAAYVHDLHVQDGYGHLGEINNGRYRIIDVTTLPTPGILGSVNVSSCHNAWPSRDGLIAVATSERSGGGLTVVDISDKRLPRAVGTYKTGGPSTSIHNAYLVDRVCHSAYYSEGYRAVDVSDPANPREVAFYDTSSSTSGFNGAWGCYPFQPSGVIYISDRSNGLHVIDSLASSARYGVATPLASGEVPSIHTFGAASGRNTKFALEVEKAPPNASVSLFLGVAAGNLNVLGVTLLVDLQQPVLVLSARTDADGKASINLVFPGDVPKATLYAQFLVVGATSLGATGGLEFHVF